MRLDNLAQFNEGVEAWIEEMEILAEAAYRGLVLAVFDYILVGTPEWSGNLVANWRVGIGAPAQDYDDIFKEQLAPGPLVDPFSKQSPNLSALHYARSNAMQVVSGISFRTPDVYISNTTPYAYEVEVNQRASDGKAFLRGVNLPVEMIYAAEQKFGAYAELGYAGALLLASKKL